MTPVLVCFALEEEAAPFRKLASAKTGVSILLTGMGRKNAGRAARDFLQQHSPELVLTCGFAGGLNPQLATGDVVFTTDDTSLQEKLGQAGARPAAFHCASRVAVTVAEKAELRRATSADAVEMESEAIEALCRAGGIPCATVRVVSDTASEDLPLDFNQFSKPDSSLHFGKLALALAKSPGRIPALLRLQKNCRFAATRLADVLVRVIERP